MSQNLPYEIHLTVQSAEVNSFKSICSKAGVKAVLLDLQNKNGDLVMKDLMTSSTHIGSDSSVWEELRRIESFLHANNLKVIRRKIETVPWHPWAPCNSKALKVILNNSYFESHLAIECTKTTQRKLQELAKELKCHLSRNVFKRTDSDKFILMLTYRRGDIPYEEFAALLQNIQNRLAESEFRVDKTIVEFALHDSKIEHDKEWIDDYP